VVLVVVTTAVLEAPTESAESGKPVPSYIRSSEAYAIIDVGGVQHLVEEGRWYTCNRLQARASHSCRQENLGVRLSPVAPEGKALKEGAGPFRGLQCADLLREGTNKLGARMGREGGRDTRMDGWGDRCRALQYTDSLAATGSGRPDADG
jgi:hypothetical protein